MGSVTTFDRRGGHASDVAPRSGGTLETLLEQVGIRIGGSRPWDIVVRNPKFARRVLTQGSLGAGESYMDGWWDCARLDEMLARVMAANLDRRFSHFQERWVAFLSLIRNSQSRRRAFQVGRQHYDIGDDLYSIMLDERLIYSCGYWKDSNSLSEAQVAKLDLVCRKLGLKPGMHVLDIGCGWGGAAQFAAERYGVHVTGVTVSNNQAVAARERCRGLPVDIQLLDYRDLTGQYDRVYSIGMFEHVGVKNYGTYFQKVRELLAPGGLFLLHTIGSNWSSTATDPWIGRYIFPNSLLPSMAQIGHALEPDWVVEDWHSFGPDYDKTLMAWMERFESGWHTIAAAYGERFRRMWRFYLAASAAGFRVRRNQLWQFVLSPSGVPGGFPEIR